MSIAEAAPAAYSVTHPVLFAGLGPRPAWSARTDQLTENAMQWSTPQYIDFRFGFEITLYVANR